MHLTGHQSLRKGNRRGLFRLQLQLANGRMVWVQFELLCKCDPHTFCYLQARPPRDNRAGWQLLRSEASRERGCSAIWWLLVFGCDLVRLVYLVVDFFADCHARTVGVAKALRWENRRGLRSKLH